MPAFTSWWSAGWGVLLGARGSLWLALLATALVAVLFQPLRERIQSAVDRLVYGERRDPYRVISALGQRLEAAIEPEAVLPAIVETVVQALKLPYVAIRLHQVEEGTPPIACGTAPQPGALLAVLPLIYQGDEVGQLLAAPRRARRASALPICACWATWRARRALPCTPPRRPWRFARRASAW